PGRLPAPAETNGRPASPGWPAPAAGLPQTKPASAASRAPACPSGMLLEHVLVHHVAQVQAVRLTELSEFHPGDDLITIAVHRANQRGDIQIYLDPARIDAKRQTQFITNGSELGGRN